MSALRANRARSTHPTYARSPRRPSARLAISDQTTQEKITMSSGRKRKPKSPHREPSGRAQRRPGAEAARKAEIVAVALAYRAREVGAKDASDPLAGFTLGRLLLRRRANESDPSGISRDQHEAGEQWADLVRRHAAIMGYALGRPRSPSLTLVGSGASCAAEPDEAEILAVRRKWSDCYNALMEACRIHGLAVRDVTYAVCVENRPIATLREADFGRLRVGLNALHRVLGGRSARRRSRLA
jgi:hypothetical protein